MELLEKPELPVAGLEPLAEPLAEVKEEIVEEIPHKESLHKMSSTQVVVLFRDKIYKMYNMFNLWYVYEYFSAPLTRPFANMARTNYLFTIDSSNKLDALFGSSEYKGLSGKDFLDEMVPIAEEEVPAKFMECILNVQRKKVAPEIPTKKILEHEAHHVAALQTELNDHIDGLAARIYAELANSKVPLEKIGYRFIFYQSSIENGLKVLYEYPNADGKLRKHFGYYAAYLFEKLYPVHHTEVSDDYTTWIQMTVLELLRKKYPFLTIEYVGSPTYIEVHLPHEKVLH